jgi:energy-coupling factor transporter ATP-binding protein EcfA2
MEKQAKNLEELYQIFDNQEYLEKGSPFYVDIFEKDIKKLKTAIKLNRNPKKKFFVAGQSGSGKTTSLNFLIDEKIEDKYSVKFIKGRDLFLLNDVDIVDILLMTGYKLIEEEEELQAEFFESLEKVRKKKLGAYEETEERRAKESKSGEVQAKAGVGTSLLSLITFNLNMFAKYKTDKTYKTTVREMFALNRRELVKEVNELIQKYKEKKNKELLLIFDDLEKMKKLDQIDELFIENGELFDELNCVKVLTIPIYLTTKNSMFNDDVFKFSFRIDKSPIDVNESDKKPEENREKLREVIFQRADRNLIDDEVIEKVIEFSGGNLRLLIQLIQRASLSAISLDDEASKITLEDFEEGVKDLRNSYATAIIDRVNTLNYILENNRLSDEQEDKLDKLRESLLDNMAFLYFNGNPWYDVNPVIKDTVRKYSKK